MDSVATFTSLKVVRNSGTLRTQVVQKLRGAIIEGVFAPGERLVERKLVDLLGVSRTLVREALRQLETEGLIQTWPYKGPAVSALTLDEVRQIYEMRGAMEGLAAKLFVERANDAAVIALASTVKTIARCHRASDVAGQRDAVEHFYDLLLAGAQNEMLTIFVASQRARLAWLRAITLSRRARSRDSIGEKRALVEAIKLRDARKARALAEAHVAAAFAGIVEVLKDQSKPQSAPQRRSA